MGESVLPGGFTQTVVRIGDTVRRRPSANARFVRDLLDRLHAVGFGDVPRWLGVDERGREILSFMPGEVPLALGHYEDAVLVAAARFIRRYHDATARLSDDGKVICHNDLSPCNFTFRDGLPVALIDFDLAAAGERLFDLGYAAWLWLDLGNEEIAIEEQRRRLVLFSDAYDPTVSPADLIDAALVRQKLLVDTYFGPVSDETREWAIHCHAFTLALTDRSSGAVEPSLK